MWRVCSGCSKIAQPTLSRRNEWQPGLPTPYQFPPSSLLPTPKAHALVVVSISMKDIEGICGMECRLGQRVKDFICSARTCAFARSSAYTCIVVMFSSTSEITCLSRLEAIVVRLELVHEKKGDDGVACR